MGRVRRTRGSSAQGSAASGRRKLRDGVSGSPGTAWRGSFKPRLVGPRLPQPEDPGQLLSQATLRPCAVAVGGTSTSQHRGGRGWPSRSSSRVIGNSNESESLSSRSLLGMTTGVLLTCPSRAVSCVSISSALRLKPREDAGALHRSRDASYQAHGRLSRTRAALTVGKRLSTSPSLFMRRILETAEQTICFPYALLVFLGRRRVACG